MTTFNPLNNIQGTLAVCTVLVFFCFIGLVALNLECYRIFKQLKALNEKLSQGASK